MYQSNKSVKVDFNKHSLTFFILYSSRAILPLLFFNQFDIYIYTFTYTAMYFIYRKSETIFFTSCANASKN